MNLNEGTLSMKKKRPNVNLLTIGSDQNFLGW